MKTFPFFNAVILTSVYLATISEARTSSRPILLDTSGGFSIGGDILSSPSNPTQTLSCGHGYVEYFIPWTPRRTSLVMWHSSSPQDFQNRWDGGEGFKDMFLRRDYPVYLWDGPAVGRANWGCQRTSYIPDYRDMGNFYAWNFGPTNLNDTAGGTVTFAQGKNWWSDSQFPIENREAWNQATRARYQEFDTDENVQLHAKVAALAADSGKLGNNIVYLTNSAAGLRAQMTVAKSNGSNIKGIVLYETAGLVFPDSANISAAPGGFGPFIVPLEEFKKLAKVPAIQFVWGDHRVGGPETFFSPHLRGSIIAADLINKYGGNAEVLILPEQPGIEKGNTHIAFADMNNDKVGALLERFLKKNNLDHYK